MNIVKSDRHGLALFIQSSRKMLQDLATGSARKQYLAKVLPPFEEAAGNLSGNGIG
ncbi:hypothetical protein [Pseudaminobacter sp. NGMCC 1.201702]|uniref:hypothetical protein n=1 Tax=Pseudaminobacter sp. NGMCC 1.201702 TaxID=3391825 RepID=UPI0039EF34F5